MLEGRLHMPRNTGFGEAEDSCKSWKAKRCRPRESDVGERQLPAPHLGRSGSCVGLPGQIIDDDWVNLRLTNA